jgi:hypothetical protein
MDTAVARPAEYGQLESLLNAGNTADALELIAKLMRSDPTDRQLRFYRLRARVMAYGPEQFEAEILSLGAEQGLSEAERANVTQILRLGFEAATRKGDTVKAWTYQRTLRRFVAGLPLDRPIASVHAIHPQPSKAPTATASAPELAQLQAIFSEEGGDSRANAGWIDSHPRWSRWLVSAVCVLVIGVAVIWVGIKLSDFVKPSQRNPMSMQAPIPLESPPVSEPAPAAVANSNRPPAESAAQVKAQTHFNGAGDPKYAEDNAATDDLLRRTAEKQKPAALPGAPARVFKAMQAVGLRDEPRFGAPKHDALERGARFIIMEQTGSWARVRHEPGGSTGYVRMEFLAPATPDS